MSDPVVPLRPDGSRAPLRRLAAPVGTLAAMAAAVTWVGTVDPGEPGHYPACLLRRLTGALCPACGGLRSTHALAHGDLAAALGANALAVVGYAAFALFWLAWLARAIRGRPGAGTGFPGPADAAPPPGPRLRPVHWWALTGLLLAFTLLRNLPLGAALRP